MWDDLVGIIYVRFGVSTFLAWIQIKSRVWLRLLPVVFKLGADFGIQQLGVGEPADGQIKIAGEAGVLTVGRPVGPTLKDERRKP